MCQERAGDWINALGLKLRSTEFITAIKYRLDLPIFRLQVGGVASMTRQKEDKKGDDAIYFGSGVVRQRQVC